MIDTIIDRWLLIDILQGSRDDRSFEVYHKIKVLIQETTQRIIGMERIMHKGYNNQ